MRAQAFGVWGSRFVVWGLEGFGSSGLGLNVPGFEILGFGFWIWAFSLQEGFELGMRRILVSEFDLCIEP